METRHLHSNLWVLWASSAEKAQAVQFSVQVNFEAPVSLWSENQHSSLLQDRRAHLEIHGSNKPWLLWVALLACFSLLCRTRSNSWPAEASIGTNGKQWCIEVQLLTNFFLCNAGILERETMVMTALYSSFCLVIKSCMREYSSVECSQGSYLHLQEAVKCLYS